VRYLQQINCDECEREFELNLQTKVVERDIHLTFFICPHCRREYKSYFTNAKIRTRLKKIQELYSKIKLKPYQHKLQQLIERKDELVRLNKLEMDNLKEKYEM
jgi:hypothetical protein